MEHNEQLTLLKRIKAIAETGLVYAQGDYDQERYTELREISLQLMAAMGGTSLQVLDDFFLPQKDYPTPKVDVRALVINEKGEILMTQERVDGNWTLPGGWGDIGNTPTEVVVREIEEETGLTAEVVRLLGVYDKQRHPHPPEPFYVYKLMFLCKITGGTLRPGFDMLDANWFAMDALPKLSEVRILKAQIEQLYQLAQEPNAPVYLD